MDTLVAELEQLYIQRLIEFDVVKTHQIVRMLFEIEDLLISQGISASEIQQLRYKVVRRLQGI